MFQTRVQKGKEENKVVKLISSAPVAAVGINALFAGVSDCNTIPILLRAWDSVRRPRAVA